MIRTILALLLIAAAIAVAVFFADHPGHVRIVWQDWQIDTSVGRLLGAAALLAIAASALALLVAALRRMPRNLRRRRALRRRRRGETSLTSGLVALAAGQAAEAGRHARSAARLLDGAPIPLLLAAEAASRQGDADAARQSYIRLLERPETEFLGLHGLIGHALRAGDDTAALRLAEQARRLRPDAAWLLDTLLALEARAGDWAAARTALAEASRRRVIPADRLRHHQGVVVYELSRQAERADDTRRAVRLAARALKLTPDLAAPAVHYARLLLALGRKRAARRAIERAWAGAPHPELARLYLDLDPEAGPLVRAAAAQRLATHNPSSIESHVAVAEAALSARLWGEARHHLTLALAGTSSSAGASRRLCRLMAELEESEAGDAARAREWLDRAVVAPPDPAHLCSHCGSAHAAWHPVCPRCGRFDTLQWRMGSPDATAIAQSPSPAGEPMLPAPRPVDAGSLPSGLARSPQSAK